MGASGFVGSHVTRKLAERGDDVRVYLRKSSKTMGIDDLDVERCYGDLYDEDALRAAMADRDVVYYCVVDTRFHLRDPAPLFETNVNCLQRVLDIATDADLHRFVFCSTIATIAIGDGRTPVDRGRCRSTGREVGGPYIESRRAGGGIGVAVCARASAARRRDECVQPVRSAATGSRTQGLMVQYWLPMGKLPVYLNGVFTEVVGIEDVADAFLLAAETRPSRRALHHLRELHVDAGDVRRPRRPGSVREATALRRSARRGVCLRGDPRVWRAGCCDVILPINVTGIRLAAHHVACRSR